MKIQIEDKRKYLSADEGKLIYSAFTPMEEQIGVKNICIPIEWDESEMFAEFSEEIDISAIEWDESEMFAEFSEEVDLNNLIEK